MLWHDLNRKIAGQLKGNLALADERPIIYIDSRKQRLFWVEIDEEENKSYDVSTAAKGLGNRVDSYKTPFGIHRIKQKVGGAQPHGMVFKAREPTGKICRNFNNIESDEITTRIMWLDGLEKGINQGGAYDTYSRYIYIHGTSDERRIGEPVSIGCIRMTNRDVIELYDNVLINDIVLIE